jgi:cytochrome c553
MRGMIFLLAACMAAPACLAAPVRFEDSMAQRTLACTSCHGREGRAGPDGYYPRLAGKPHGYLFNQLLNFREGRRHYGLMSGLVDPLSDAYLYEVARYFAELDAPYPPPQAAAAPPEILDRGRTLAHDGDASKMLPACVSCHGKALTGVQPNVPGLLGLSRDYLNAQLGAWRTGQRRAHVPDCMGVIARRLEPEDLAAVTAFLAAEALPRNTKPAAAAVVAAAPVRTRARKGAPVAAAEPPPPTMRCGSAVAPAGSRP